MSFIDRGDPAKKRMAGRSGVILILLFLMFSLSGVATGQENDVGETMQKPAVSAASAVVMDHRTGRILYSKGMNQQRYIASTTKIMTAIIAIEKGRLKEVVVVSERAASTGGSSIWLESGEKKTLEELLYGLMLRSGNDAAIAIAEHIGGSVEEFVALMNEKAREIGAEKTFFENPHGLHHKKHRSTAYDLALISSYAMKNEIFRRIVVAPRAIITWPEHEWDRILHNQNRLLQLYDGADGVKTGWTTPAGRCFVGSAFREGQRLIVVVLDAPDMWEDASLLLDYGFAAYKVELLIAAGQVIKTVQVDKGLQEQAAVAAGASFYYPLAAGELPEVRYRFCLEEPYRAPLKKGKKIGTLEIMFHDKIIGSVDLVAGEGVSRAPFYRPLLELWEKVMH
ncbi:MAG: D-alanyl-D-alanine carboxypeptidase [Firmicutes bacterium]|nr:D-alanyl-D-alanine carboxypeptidase [Bacillota bacterium]